MTAAAGARVHCYCFGDSITYGDSDTERGGWVARLKTECLARSACGELGADVFNLGIGGETTRLMRARFSPELEARLEGGARSLVTLAYGANDAAESDGSFLVPEKEYAENLAWAIDEARRQGCEVWLLNVTPLAPAADGVRSLGSGRLRSNALVSRYNDLLRQLAHQKRAELLDVHAAFMRHDLSSLFAPDGLHPNAEGHALIANLVGKRLLRK
ncbi:MAG TPA: SGNH/GDSL hydrolase family protein [Polyangia bacterium]